MRTLLLATSSLFALPLSGQALPQTLFDGAVLRTDLAEEMELLGDVDNDGDIDAIAFLYVGASVLKSSFRPLLNDGQGIFTPGTPVPIPPQAGHYVHCADVDGDGRLDVLVATSTAYAAGAGVLVYRGLGGAQFAAPLHVPLPGNLAALGSGNANGDGIADVFVLHFTATGMQARWLLGGPGLALPTGQSTVFAGMLSVGTALLDVDGDGVTDFAALTPAGAGIAASLLRTTAAGFAAYATLPVSPSFVNLLVAADVDGDGLQDLLSARLTGTLALEIVTLHNGGAAGFSATTQTTTGSAIYNLAVADWDGDGDGDFVARGGTDGVSNPSHALTVYENVGGTFVARRYDTVPGAAVNLGAGCADLDGDGKPDFVDSRAFLFGTGTTVRPPRPYIVSPDDWDEDGDLDHIARLDARLQDGNGQFTTLTGFWPPSPGPNLFHGDPVASADFDGGGRREMIVPLIFQPFGTQPTFVEMRRLQANGDLRLVDVGAAAAPGAAMQGSGVADDADGDGDVDIVNGQGLWQNDGAGHFTLLPQSFANFRPAAKGDVDGDGDQDLLAVVNGLPSLAILRHTGPTTYTLDVLLAPSSLVLESTPARFADLDDDGDLDAIAKERVTSGLARTAIFVNTGGAFAAGPTLAPTGNLVAADIDGDGRTDVCIQTEDRLYVYLRVGPGLVYAPPIVFALRGVTGGADLDQDGDIDLLGSETQWNRRFEPPAAGERRQYGLGGAGTGGMRPLLSLVGTLRVGQTPAVRLVGAYGGSFAVLFASGSEANVPNALPGVTSFVGPSFVALGATLSGALGQPGAGTVEFPINIPAGAGGAQLFLQCLVLDPAAPISLTYSNGCELLVGL